MDIQQHIGGVVLAGGLSTRMGRDKATLVGHDGKELLQKNVELLQQLFAHVWVSCRIDAPFENYPCVFDALDNVGPLAGIHASLEYAHSLKLTAIMVVACDMPSLTKSALETLISARNHAVQCYGELADTVEAIAEEASVKVTAYCQKNTNFFQGLGAIWEVCARTQMLKDMTGAAQERRLWRIVPPACQNLVIYEGGELDNIFVNLNTPQDLNKFLHTQSEKG